MTLDAINRLFAALTDLDTALRIHDCSNETLLAVAERLEQSSLPRHCILSSNSRRSTKPRNYHDITLAFS